MPTPRRTKSLPPDPTYVTTFKLPSGSRSYVVNAGDRISVKPSRPGKRDGFEARVLKAKVCPETGAIRWVDVTGWDARAADASKRDLDSVRGQRTPSAVRSIAPERLQYHRPSKD